MCLLCDDGGCVVRRVGDSVVVARVHAYVRCPPWCAASAVEGMDVC